MGTIVDRVLTSERHCRVSRGIPARVDDTVISALKSQEVQGGIKLVIVISLAQKRFQAFGREGKTNATQRIALRVPVHPGKTSANSDCLLRRYTHTILFQLRTAQESGPLARQYAARMQL